MADRRPFPWMIPSCWDEEDKQDAPTPTGRVEVVTRNDNSPRGKRNQMADYLIKQGMPKNLAVDKANRAAHRASTGANKGKP